MRCCHAVRRCSDHVGKPHDAQLNIRSGIVPPVEKVSSQLSCLVQRSNRLTQKSAPLSASLVALCEEGVVMLDVGTRRKEVDFDMRASRALSIFSSGASRLDQARSIYPTVLRCLEGVSVRGESSKIYSPSRTYRSSLGRWTLILYCYSIFINNTMSV